MKRPWWKRLLVSTILLILLASAAGTVVAVAGLDRSKQSGQEAWDASPAWAGLGEQDEESGTIYWCPMHPQIKKKEPSTCPICNMAPAPLEAGASDQPPTHLVLTVRQVQQAGVVTEPVLRRPLQGQYDRHHGPGRDR